MYLTQSVLDCSNRVRFKKPDTPRHRLQKTELFSHTFCWFSRKCRWYSINPPRPPGCTRYGGQQQPPAVSNERAYLHVCSCWERERLFIWGYWACAYMYLYFLFPDFAWAPRGFQHAAISPPPPFFSGLIYARRWFCLSQTLPEFPHWATPLWRRRWVSMSILNSLDRATYLTIIYLIKFLRSVPAIFVLTPRNITWFTRPSLALCAYKTTYSPHAIRRIRHLSRIKCTGCHLMLQWCPHS